MWNRIHALCLAAGLHFVDGQETVNDECSGAFVVPSLPTGTVSDSIANATADFATQVCGVSADANGVWYQYTPTETKIVRLFVEWNGSGGPTVLRTFTGDSCENLACINKNGPNYGSYDSTHIWIAESAVPYYFLISSTGLDQELAFNVDIQDYEVPTSNNNDCANPTVINALPYVAGDSTVGALQDFEFKTCDVDATSNGVWYSYTPTETKIVQFVVEWSGTGGATTLRTFVGDSCESLNCIDKNGPYNSYDSSNTFIAESGVTYHFHVSPVDFELGIVFNVDVVDYDVPDNSDCSTPTMINALPYRAGASSVGALQDFEFQTCNVDATSNGVWYSYTPAETKIVRFFVEWNGSGGPTTLRTFTGSPCDSLVCTNDNGPNYGTYDSSHTFIAESGVAYSFLVAPVAFELAIVFNVDVVDYDVPANNDCSSPTVINSLPYQAGASSVGALQDFEFPTCDVDDTANGIWYAYTPAETRIVRFFVEWNGSGGATILRTFTGTSCDSLVCLDKDGPYGSYDSSHTFIGDKDSTYYFLVSPSSFELGIIFNIDFQDYDVPTNNDCSTPTVIDSLPYQAGASSVGALTDFDFDTCGVAASANGVWYSFVGDGRDVGLTVSGMGSIRPVVRIFSGSCPTPACLDKVGPSSSVVSYDWTAEKGVTYRFLITESAFSVGFTFTVELAVSTCVVHGASL